MGFRVLAGGARILVIRCCSTTTTCVRSIGSSKRPELRQVLSALDESFKKNLDIGVALDGIGAATLDTFTVSSVLGWLNEVSAASRFFKWAIRQPGYTHNSKNYEAFVRVFLRNGQLEQAHKFLKEEAPGCGAACHALLKAYAEAGMMQEALSIQKEALVHISRTAVGNCILEGTLKRDVDEGLGYLRTMKNRNPATFNIVMSSCFKAGRYDDAFRCIEEMATTGFIPSTMTYGTVLDGLTNANRIDDACRIFEAMDRAPGLLDGKSEIGAPLIHRLIKTGRADEALDKVTRLAAKGGQFRQHTIRGFLIGLSHRGFHEQAMELFRKMPGFGFGPELGPDSLMVTSILEQVCKMKKLDLAMELYMCSLNMGLSIHEGTIWELIHGLCFENRIDDSLGVLQCRIDSGSLRGLGICYMIVVQALIKLGRLHEALDLYERVLEGGGNPNEHVCFELVDGFCKDGLIADALKACDLSSCPYDSLGRVLLEALRKAKMAGNAKEIVTYLTKSGVSFSSEVFNSIVTELFEMKDVEGAMEVFKLMLGNHQESTYNTVIEGLCSAGRCSDALEIFEKDVANPDATTYKSLIHGLCKAGAVDEALKVYEHQGCPSNSVSHCMIIDGLCKAGRVGQAKELFFELLDKREVLLVPVYNALITGLMDAGNVDEGLDMYHLMVKNGTSRDPVTLAIVLGGLCKAERLEEAFQMLEHAMVEEDVDKKTLLGIRAYNFVLNKLVKENQMDRALELFDRLKARGCEPVTTTYNIVLRALGQSGRFIERRECFDDMVARGRQCHVCSPEENGGA